MNKVRKFNRNMVTYLKKFRKAFGSAPSETTWY